MRPRSEGGRDGGWGGPCQHAKNILSMCPPQGRARNHLCEKDIPCSYMDRRSPKIGQCSRRFTMSGHLMPNSRAFATRRVESSDRCAPVRMSAGARSCLNVASKLSAQPPQPSRGAPRRGLPPPPPNAATRGPRRLAIASGPEARKYKPDPARNHPPAFAKVGPLMVTPQPSIGTQCAQASELVDHRHPSELTTRCRIHGSRRSPDARHIRNGGQHARRALCANRGGRCFCVSSRWVCPRSSCVLLG